MCFEDERTEIVGESVVYTRTSYGLGARGIDYIEKKVGSAAATVGFPVYDSHGNMVMTLSRSGSSWADGLHRGFGVWGSVRWNPSSSSDVKQRYCANLGHVEDDESGVIYMRARYYEPWTGRFVSEDPALHGSNWYTYCANSPVVCVDETGRSETTPTYYYENVNKWVGPMAAIALMVLATVRNTAVRIKTMADIGFLEVWWAMDLDDMAGRSGYSGDLRVLGALLMNAMTDIIGAGSTWQAIAGELAENATPGLKAIEFYVEHMAFLSLFMSLESIVEENR